MKWIYRLHTALLQSLLSLCRFLNSPRWSMRKSDLYESGEPTGLNLDVLKESDLNCSISFFLSIFILSWIFSLPPNIGSLQIWAVNSFAWTHWHSRILENHRVCFQASDSTPRGISCNGFISLLLICPLM